MGMGGAEVSAARRGGWNRAGRGLSYMDSVKEKGPMESSFSGGGGVDNWREWRWRPWMGLASSRRSNLTRGVDGGIFIPLLGWRGNLPPRADGESIMRTRTLVLSALLCLTALAVIPPPVAAMDLCQITCAVVPAPCTMFANGCPSPTCIPLLAGISVDSLGNHAGATVTVNRYCQVGETGIPLPPYYCPCFPLLNVDPAQPNNVCVTAGVGYAPATVQCIGVDSIGCLNVNGATVSCPLPPACTYPASPVGGLVGGAILYAEQIGTIACNAAAASAATAGAAATTTTNYVVGQIPCRSGCGIVVDPTVPDWVAAYANAVVAAASGQINGQSYLLCAFVVGSGPCGVIAPGTTTGSCPVIISRTDGGIIGDAERYAGSSCDAAQSGASAITGATVVAAAQVKVIAAEAVGTVNAVVAYEVAGATTYAGQMTGYANSLATTATTAATQACTATTTYAVGTGCPV